MLSETLKTEQHSQPIQAKQTATQHSGQIFHKHLIPLLPRNEIPSPHNCLSLHYSAASFDHLIGYECAGARRSTMLS